MNRPVAAALGVALVAGVAFGIWGAIYALASHLAWWQFAGLGVLVTLGVTIAMSARHAIKAEQATQTAAGLGEEHTP